MIVAKHWTVDVFVDEQDRKTYAEARLHTDGDAHVAGTGEARLHPSDKDIPEIGDELAVARAVSDLGHQLLVTTAADIEAASDRRAHITRGAATH